MDTIWTPSWTGLGEVIQDYLRGLSFFGRVSLDIYTSPLKARKNIVATEFVAYSNNLRYREWLNNLTPADVYQGGDRRIPTMRDRIKERTLELRRSQNLLKSS